jgi:hypothetical protein
MLSTMVYDDEGLAEKLTSLHFLMMIAMMVLFIYHGDE